MPECPGEAAEWSERPAEAPAMVSEASEAVGGYPPGSSYGSECLSATSGCISEYFFMLPRIGVGCILLRFAAVWLQIGWFDS